MSFGLFAILVRLAATKVDQSHPNGKKIIRSWWIRFLGSLSLLWFVEAINLWIHSKLSSYSLLENDPIIMLVALLIVSFPFEFFKKGYDDVIHKL